MCANYAEKQPLEIESDSLLFTDESITDSLDQSDPRQELQGYRLTWGATPLNFDGFNNNQMVVYNALTRRIQKSAPESTPDNVKEFMLQHFRSRFFERQNRNAESFNHRYPLVIDDLDGQYGEILGAAINATSNPNDLIKLREKLNMPSIELARLTHPYGMHMETLDEMRIAVDFAIENNGGRLIENDSMTTFGVDGSHIRNKGENIELGFLMKRKRVRGVLPDGTVIIERSTFVLRVDDESLLSQDIAKQFRSIKIDKNPDWNKQVMEIIAAHNLIPGLLDDNQFDIAIPLSTTTYAYNPRLDYELEQARNIKCEPEGPVPEWLVKAREQENQRAKGKTVLKNSNLKSPR